MTSTCPHCGKPIRPGAKFCGSCGKTIQTAQPQPSSPDAQVACPHCGKPVRKDARFCASCGQSIPAPAATPSPQKPAAGPAPKPQKTIPPPPKRKSFFARFWWLILLIIFVCVIAPLGAFLYFDPFNIISADTPTPTQTNITEESSTPELIDTETPTATLTDTPTLPATATETVIPTATNTPEPTSPEETATPTNTEIVTETPKPTPITLVDEDFEGELEPNWNVWGTPIPEIKSGFGNYLELNAEPRGAGITSNDPLPIFKLLPNTIIQFNANTVGFTTQDLLSVDWDPVQTIRRVGAAPGILHFDIGNLKMKLVVNNITICDIQIIDAKDEPYQITIDEAGMVSLKIGDLVVCNPIQVVLPTDDGKISFSGRGKIDSILITQIGEK